MPAIEELVARHPQRTLFTRFIPAERPGEGPGMWASYYRRWAEVTLSHIDPGLIELMPQLARFVPPAKLVDKHVYSPWTEGHLDALLHGAGRHRSRLSRRSCHRRHLQLRGSNA
ncbi:hypothetical protein [Mesorhizobium sp. M7D.F.Ca.US.004.03.1.1]|uniref:hypothetical protein n=1 Tax=unclassified Mesorhizobium TaxID=325217 RepID=UPI0032AEF91F